ncbi:MAG: MupG family TIM beta-alpha barrel fold protein [Victivallales bacterium]|nr:MupG family TIM beta-alpha barrel fold protein [Victivallales bacterium]
MDKLNWRGTALYLGLGESLEIMEKHLEKAGKAGINGLFTSLNMPEANRNEVLRDMPRLTALAHRYGLKVDADVSAKTAGFFGIDKMDIKSFKELGLDVIRLDYGYSYEQMAELSENSLEIMLEINASVGAEALQAQLRYLSEHGADMNKIRTCHNYYPMPFTGLSVEYVKKCNTCCRQWGVRTGAFIASPHHYRPLPCHNGLPTLERHRGYNVFPAIQELLLLGIDDISFGDDLASESELRELGKAEKGIAKLRFIPQKESGVVSWVEKRTFKRKQCGTGAFIRSMECFDKPPLPNQMFPRKRGDVIMCAPGFNRYAGELEIVLRDLPPEPRTSFVGHIVEEDVPVLDIMVKSNSKFQLIPMSDQS